jgi:hypothetical protein
MLTYVGKSFSDCTLLAASNATTCGKAFTVKNLCDLRVLSGEKYELAMYDINYNSYLFVYTDLYISLNIRISGSQVAPAAVGHWPKAAPVLYNKASPRVHSHWLNVS